MEHDQHALTKKNNALMIRMDRKREKNRVANEAKQSALSKRISPKERQTSTKHETPEGQRKNATLRKGTKRPESGPWPIAK